MLATGAPAMLYGLRSSMHPDAFQHHDGNPFPIAVIDESDAKGIVEMKPQGSAILPADELESIALQMHEQTKKLSQLDADTLDALCILWMRDAKHPEDFVTVHIDAIPELRGLKPKKGGSGRRGGYGPEQRREHADSLRRVSHLHTQMHELALYRDNGSKTKARRRETRRGVEGPAFSITLMGQTRLDGGLDVDSLRFLPGAAFLLYLWGPGRQTALIDAKILRYDPYRQEQEKLLGRYLSWQWKIRSTKGTYSKPYRVSTLLKESRLQLNAKEPARTRERMEKALDRLQHDGVIRSWRYERWSLGNAPRVGWAEPWLRELVIIEPPDSVVSYYLGNLRGALPDGEPSPLADRLRATRERLELTQAQASETAGITQQAYSRAERGKGVTVTNRGKLEAWLASHKVSTPESE
ncbi:MAG: helix-turn-helix transcriptional regulator [Actinomycetota bacterium]|nr:helix-turn-helix transcriptional regulator [Actinomycetota bacterium]